MADMSKYSEETVDMFDMQEALARSTDPATSHMAAEKVNVGKVEALVLESLARYGPQCWDQLVRTTGRKPGSISPRFAPLLRKGMIQKHGEVEVVGGQRQIVWEITDRGLSMVTGLTLPDPSQCPHCRRPW